MGRAVADDQSLGLDLIARTPTGVNDTSVISHPHLEAAILRACTKVDILVVEEEARIEAPERIEDAAPNRERRAGDPPDAPRSGVLREAAAEPGPVQDLVPHRPLVPSRPDPPSADIQDC